MPLQSLATPASTFTARDAIATHIRWRMRLQLAIRLQEPLSSNALRAIRHSSECTIGRWLLSAHTASLRRTPQYLALVNHHEQFHREMLQIATLIGQQDFVAAELGLAPQGSFQRASQAIANAITALDRVYTIQIER